MKYQCKTIYNTNTLVYWKNELEHSPLFLLNLSTVPHFSRLCFLTYNSNEYDDILIAYVIAYNLTYFLDLITLKRGMLRFSSSSNLIRTYLNHLIRFLNYRCTNSGLIIQKHIILGILGTHVPVHPEHVPVHVAFWWGVPVHPCTCTGTPWPLVGCTGTPLYMYRYTFRNLPRFCFFCHFCYQFTSYNFYNS